MTIDNKLYHSVEQYFQHHKAEHFEKPDVATKILQAKYPSECKRIGDSIKEDNMDWTQAAKDAMLTGVKRKFTTNERCKSFLISTNDSILAEASSHKLWGTGLKLDDPANGTREKWPGQNCLGSILMEVRKELDNGLT